MTDTDRPLTEASEEAIDKLEALAGWSPVAEWRDDLADEG